MKTPLQRAVQILKRHRDVHFRSRPNVKPVSIILTTLAAHAYENQEDTYEALTIIARDMPSYIEDRDGRWWVQNPVDPGENFADKWNEYPERHEAFMRWLEKVHEDLLGVLSSGSLNERLLILKDSVGERTMAEVAAKLGTRIGNPQPAATPGISSGASEKSVLHKLERAAGGIDERITPMAKTIVGKRRRSQATSRSSWKDELVRAFPTLSVVDENGATLVRGIFPVESEGELLDRTGSVDRVVTGPAGRVELHRGAE